MEQSLTFREIPHLLNDLHSKPVCELTAEEMRVIAILKHAENDRPKLEELMLQAEEKSKEFLRTRELVESYLNKFNEKQLEFEETES